MARVFTSLVGVALLAVTASTADDDVFRWKGRLPAGQTIEIKGVNGDVEAAASGDEVEVTATKRAKRSDPSSVRIEAVEHADGVTICAVYPPAGGGRPNECAPGHKGRMSVRDNDVSVDFTVRVPAGVRFVGRTVNGGVDARDLEGDAEGYSVNGGVEISCAGEARAETVNGGIEATLGRMDGTEPLSFATVNGSIRLALPAGAGADVRAKTVNGDIRSEFPLTVRGRFGPKKVEGVIGGGGRRLELETVNGAIELVQAK